jgi:hypothetical protein
VLTVNYTEWCNRRMDLKTFLKSLPDDEARAAFALRCESTLGHVRNVSYGLRPCSTELAVAIERESDGAVTRPELCPESWRARWPELSKAHDQIAATGG